MALMDMESMFSDAQAITASAASENVIDLGAPGTPMHAAGAITQDIGRGRPIPVLIQVVEDFATLTSLQVTLEVDADNSWGAGNVKVLDSLDVGVADLVAGKKFNPFYIPEETNLRYVRLYYTVTGSNATAGKITAGLVFGRNNWVA